MSFDKIKAMRNAERFLAQGKIRAAINEYKRVVESDPKDFSTLNMLGDLYAKAADPKEAVLCFTLVAEHYGKQGFAQKAIAIYNKISRLTPESPEISAKLAQLYQSKGSVAEARSHYSALADQYQRSGNKSEALMVWRQIAEMDPNNTDIYLKIAEASLQDNQRDEAATAYIEAGIRLSAKRQNESAITAFFRGLEIRPNDLIGLKGVVKSQISLGYTDEAAKILERVLENEPYNREVLLLLIDCYLDTNNPQDAERVVIQLVEKEPANYAKFLDVVKSYLKEGDLNSAARLISMTAEHLLVGGQARELEKWVNEVLARNPEHVDALRLLVRLHGWERDEAELKIALERLLEAARLTDSVEDERYALTQLVLMMPHEVEFAHRLQQINEAYGYTETPVEYQPQYEQQSKEVPTYENYGVYADDRAGSEPSISSEPMVVDYAEYMPEQFESNHSASDSKDFQFAENSSIVVEDYTQLSADHQPLTSEEIAYKTKLDHFEEARLQQELESIDFYVKQGYQDLAINSLDLLETEFGKRSEIENYRRQITPPEVETAAETAAEIEAPFVLPNVEDVETPFQTFEMPLQTEEFKQPETFEFSNEDAASFDIMGDFRDELGLEEPEPVAEGDYETHYHLGIAYKEMGLMEDSIREFQDAVKLVTPNDGTRRFFLCCNLLGHCFMDKQMPNLALMWYKRCLETANLNPEERQGLRYEVANAYEVGGDAEKAIEYFEDIYVENVDYRDVGDRLKYLQAQ